MLPVFRGRFAIVVYFSLLVLASDGASLYEYPQYEALDSQPSEQSLAGSPYVPLRYNMASPESSYVSNLFLRPRLQTATTDFENEGPQNLLKGLYQQDPSIVARALTRASGWNVLQNLQQHMKPEPQTRSSSVEYEEPRVAVKRFWGAYQRPRQHKDRRATKNRHYECLKSCIKEGKLHPIQCHTLC